MSNPDFQMGVDARLIYDRIVSEKGNHGKRIGYEEMSRLCGRPLAQIRGALRTARNAAQRDHRVVTGTVHREGIEILAPLDAVRLGMRSQAKIRGEAKRGARKVAAVEYEKLDESGKREHNVALSVLGALSAVASRSAEKRLEAGVEATGKRLDLGATLRLCGGGSEAQ